MLTDSDVLKRNKSSNSITNQTEKGTEKSMKTPDKNFNIRTEENGVQCKAAPHTHPKKVVVRITEVTNM